MRPIPLNLQTLYADLIDQVSSSTIEPASISRRKVKGQTFLYATIRDGSIREQRYLGPGSSSKAQAMAARHKAAEEQAKQRRSTVSALKRQRIPAPTLQVGRVLETIANAGLFNQGVVLVGTHAFRLYPCVTGHFLPNTGLVTNDVDISAAAFVAGDEPQDLEAILKRADKTFEPVWAATDKAPKMFKASNGLTIDVLTRKGRGRRSPVVIDGLGVSAEALSFQEFLVEDTIEVVALYNCWCPSANSLACKVCCSQAHYFRPARCLKPKKRKGLGASTRSD